MVPNWTWEHRNESVETASSLKTLTRLVRQAELDDHSDWTFHQKKRCKNHRTLHYSTLLLVSLLPLQRIFASRIWRRLAEPGAGTVRTSKVIELEKTRIILRWNTIQALQLGFENENSIYKNEVGQKPFAEIRSRSEIREILEECFLNFKRILQLSVHMDTVTTVITQQAKNKCVILFSIYFIPRRLRDPDIVMVMILWATTFWP